MRILIYDNNEQDLIHFYELIHNIPLDFKIDKISSLDQSKTLYNKNIYDLVFIDFTSDTGKNILSYIKNSNPKQKIITMSDSFECSEKKGCDFCKASYNARRIIKPIDNTELISSISQKELKCEYDFYNSDTLSKVTVIAKKYKSFVLDKDNLRLNFNAKVKTFLIADEINISKDLDNHNINYKMNEKYIQIVK